jgi:hypothetical protein
MVAIATVFMTKAPPPDAIDQWKRKRLFTFVYYPVSPDY